MIEIREGTTADQKDIEKLFKGSTVISPEDPGTRWILAYDGKEIIGAASLLVVENSGFIRYLMIKENRRGEKLGDGIVKSLLNYADYRGVQRVITNNIELTNFYKKIGFKTVSEDLIGVYASIFTLEELSIDNTLEVKLPEFFQTVCKSHSNKR